MATTFYFSHVYTIGSPINFAIYVKLKSKGHKAIYLAKGVDGIKFNEHQKMFYMLNGGKVIDPEYCPAGKLVICKITTPKDGYNAVELQDLLTSHLDYEYHFDHASQCYIERTF